MPPLMYIFISLFIILTSFKYSHKFSHKFSHKYSDKSKINIAKHDHISSAVQVGGGGQGWGNQESFIQGGSVVMSKPLTFIYNLRQKTKLFQFHVDFNRKWYPLHIPTIEKLIDLFSVVLFKTF